MPAALRCLSPPSASRSTRPRPQPSRRLAHRAPRRHPARRLTPPSHPTPPGSARARPVTPKPSCPQTLPEELTGPPLGPNAGRSRPGRACQSAKHDRSGGPMGPCARRKQRPPSPGTRGRPRGWPQCAGVMSGRYEPSETAGLLPGFPPGRTPPGAIVSALMQRIACLLGRALPAAGWVARNDGPNRPPDKRGP